MKKCLYLLLQIGPQDIMSIKKTKDRKYTLFMKGGGEGINTIYKLFHSIFFNGKNNSKTYFFNGYQCEKEKQGGEDKDGNQISLMVLSGRCDFGII